MSAAALRCGARRTVGGRALQRTRAAVEEEQRRRLIHSGTPLSFPRVSPFTTASGSNAKGLTGENEARNVTERQIKRMKEELYTTMTEQKQHNSNYDHFRLLDYLSGQIEPRRDDPRWRSYRRGQAISDCLRFAGIYFLASVVIENFAGY